MNDKSSLAVSASLSGNWEEAIELNSEILEIDPDNIPALNRLGRAYAELGQKDSAKEIYERVLSFDKYNAVASRGLKTLHTKLSISKDPTMSDENFIEDSGTTRSAQLIKLAEKKVLLSLKCKQALSLLPKSRLISVVNENKVHLGCLPDDLSLKMAKLIKSGYAYSTCVKSFSESQLTVFIREIKRPKSLTASATFSRAGVYTNAKIA